MDLRTFVTPWVMTLFTKGTSLKLVYEIFDHYMAQNDKLFLFYMVTGLIVKNAEKIIELDAEDDDVLFITFVNRKMKEESLATPEDVAELFKISE